jgi:hypothetical protein
LSKIGHFEGCCNLDQKKNMLRGLRDLGRSPGFVRCACDFVEGLSVEKYLPTAEEEDAVIQRYLERERE